MRFTALVCLAAMLGLSSQVAAARPATGEPAGVIEMASRAQLSGLPAFAGATVLPGETLVTDTGGAVQLRAGVAQVFLGASTNATLLEASQLLHATVTQGNVRFSSPSSLPVAIETPAGILRGEDGYAVAGMVTVNDSENLVVSAISENLILDNDGELHMIRAGRSYRVAVSEEPADQGADGNSPPAPRIHIYNRRRRRKLALWLIGGGVAAFAAGDIWEQDSESPYKPANHN
jgi:hypothetical protein